MTPPARLTGKSCGTSLTKATLTTHIQTCITTQHYSDAPLSSERPPDAVDDDAGHGSHCSASIAGNCEYGSSTSMSKYNGLAYNAKVAFFDIGVTGTNELNPPLYLDSEMFLPMYNGMCVMILPVAVVEIHVTKNQPLSLIHPFTTIAAGARIFSNSWGAPQDNSYNFFANSVDKFMYNYPDALVLFAAGRHTPTIQHTHTLPIPCQSNLCQYPNRTLTLTSTSCIPIPDSTS